jgi:hypothetical protein
MIKTEINKIDNEEITKSFIKCLDQHRSLLSLLKGYHHYST